MRIGDALKYLIRCPEIELGVPVLSPFYAYEVPVLSVPVLSPRFKLLWFLRLRAGLCTFGALLALVTLFFESSERAQRPVCLVPIGCRLLSQSLNHNSRLYSHGFIQSYVF
jgi:hypothetical protein